VLSKIAPTIRPEPFSGRVEGGVGVPRALDGVLGA
jgi:hypothetical protein